MRRAIAATGRVLVTVGLLLLLFVAYQLWGTGIYEARAQARLARDFRHQLAAVQQSASTTTTVPTEAPTTTTIAPPAPPPSGALAIIRIPAIGVDRVVVEGVSVADLRKGPGHYPDTPLPGELGNAAIAGHRTTYGAPFYRLDELQAGDAIVVTTLAGTFHYVVTGSDVVKPTQLSVLEPTSDATLTLTTCEPRFSSASRLVVHATLDRDADNPVPQPPSNVNPDAGSTTGSPTGDTAGISEQRPARGPTVLWGVILAVIGLLWWWWFHRYRRWTTWFVGAIPFALVLFVFYAHVERLLPSSY